MITSNIYSQSYKK
jgi:hypothetical protein